MDRKIYLEFPKAAAPLLHHRQHHNSVQQIHRRKQCPLVELDHRRVSSGRRLSRSPQSLLLHAQIPPQAKPLNFSLHYQILFCTRRSQLGKASPPASIHPRLRFRSLRIVCTYRHVRQVQPVARCTHCVRRNSSEKCCVMDFDD